MRKSFLKWMASFLPKENGNLSIHNQSLGASIIQICEEGLQQESVLEKIFQDQLTQTLESGKFLLSSQAYAESLLKKLRLTQNTSKIASAQLSPITMEPSNTVFLNSKLILRLPSPAMYFQLEKLHFHLFQPKLSLQNRDLPQCFLDVFRNQKVTQLFTSTLFLLSKLEK